MICLISAIIIKFRSSRPEVLPKKVALKSIAKLTGNHLCQSFFFNKVAGLRPTTLSKKRLWHRCFLVNFAKFLRAPFFIEHPWLLLLKFDIFKQPLCHTVQLIILSLIQINNVIHNESHTDKMQSKKTRFWFYFLDQTLKLKRLKANLNKKAIIQIVLRK